MSKKKLLLLLSTLACTAATALAPAQAATNEQTTIACDNSSIGKLSSACLGPIKNSAIDSTYIEGNDYAFFRSSKSSDAFIDAPNGVSEGTLRFDETLFGRFVVGLRAGNMFSFYLFEGDDEGTSSIAFDTEGVVQRGSGQDGVLTEAYLFTPGGVLPEARVPADGRIDEQVATAPPAPQQVPEPATGALALAALAAAGLVARRRRG